MGVDPSLISWLPDNIRGMGEVVKTYKFLGVYLDWSANTDALYKK